MVFKSPWILLLIPMVVGLSFFIRAGQRPGLRFPSLDLFAGVPTSWKIQFRWVPPILRILAILLFILALAGPRKILKETVHKTEGIDIVLSIDCSGSMAAEDFKINNKRFNRLTVVKNVVRDFIEKREGDRIGIIAFAGRAYTVCPLTTDYNWLLANFNRIQLGLLEDGTAVGSGIASGVNRLKNSTAKSKVIILLTDGVNNAGNIDPLTAAKIAKKEGVKVYTIGAGARGYAPFPVQDFFGRTVFQNVPVEIDEETLQEVAKITDGKYYRATDTESLMEIYQEIDSLEKSKIEQLGYREYQELFGFFLLPALIILFGEVILSRTVFLRIP